MKRLIQIEVSLLLVVCLTLSGCAIQAEEKNNPATTTQTSSDKAARTKEQAMVEAKFTPLFDFLAQEEKDFSKVERYSATFSISKQKDGEYVEQQSESTYFELDSSKKTATYQVNKNGEKHEQPLPLAEICAKNDLLFPVIPTDDFHKLPISDYLAKHPETDLSSITYDTDKTMPFVKQLMTKYHFNSIDSSSLSVYKNGDREYNFIVKIRTNGKKYMLTMFVKFREK